MKNDSALSFSVYLSIQKLKNLREKNHVSTYGLHDKNYSSKNVGKNRYG